MNKNNQLCHFFFLLGIYILVSYFCFVLKQASHSKTNEVTLRKKDKSRYDKFTSTSQKEQTHIYTTLRWLLLTFDGIWHNTRTKLYPWELSWSLPYCSCRLVNRLQHCRKKRCCLTELVAEGCTLSYNR